MSALEIKNDLLRLLVETDDSTLLEKVRNYFKILKKEPLSKEALEVQELAMAEIGIEQIKSSQVMSHEEARKKIEARLRKPKK
ncbi:MAG: hypothetical protein R2788_07315 [Saprospiraceae bacterium]|jgi:hypothetical protein